jgi:hypothetical protein
MSVIAWTFEAPVAARFGPFGAKDSIVIAAVPGPLDVPVDWTYLVAASEDEARKKASSVARTRMDQMLVRLFMPYLHFAALGEGADAHEYIPIPWGRVTQETLRASRRVPRRPACPDVP